MYGHKCYSKYFQLQIIVMLSPVLLRTWPLFRLFNFLNKGRKTRRKASGRLDSLSNLKKKPNQQLYLILTSTNHLHSLLCFTRHKQLMFSTLNLIFCRLMDTLHNAFSLIKLKCQRKWDWDLDMERKQMLSFQNLQANKHDVEDGMSTDMKQRRRGK